jgi:hypothetical protein
MKTLKDVYRSAATALTLLPTNATGENSPQQKESATDSNEAAGDSDEKSKCITTG